MMRKLNTVRLLALMGALLSFSFIQSAKASHLLGADMTINQYEKGKFEIRVNVYVDCNSLSSLRYSPVVVKSKCGNYTHSNGYGPYGNLDITPVCKTECTKCSSSSCTSGFGIRQVYFVDTIDISSVSCDEFTVAWEQKSRSSKITTGANDQNFYIEGSFNKANFKEKTSVYFSTSPLLIVAKGACVSNFQAISTIGFDSVSYALADPLSGSGATIPYISGYSKDDPLKYEGYPDHAGTFDPPVCKGFHFNETTGEMNFKTTQTDITPIVVEATVWVKDSTGSYVKAVTIRRDVVLSIIESPQNRQPSLAGFNCTKSNTIHICAGSKLEATICAFDPDLDDTVTIDWDNSIAGASFFVPKMEKWPKAVFSWTPDTTMIRKEPYHFIVTASDGACPIPAKTFKVFYVYVHKPKMVFQYKKTGSCNKYTFKADSGSSAAGATYQWVINGKTVGTKPELTYRFDTTGKYPVKLIVSQGCDQVFYDTIEVNRPSILSASKTEVMEGDFQKLTAANGQKFTWWVGKDTLTQKTADITFKALRGRNYYHVLVTDTVSRCEWHDSILVNGLIVVWPGDANKDGEADYKDLLNVGLGYGSFGPARQDTFTLWMAKKATAWGKKTSYVDDYAHLDCNGDGYVSTQDTSAISRNYDQARETARTSTSSGPPIQFEFRDSVQFAGNSLIVDVYLGSNTATLYDVNGLAFSYEYPERYFSKDPKFAWQRNFGIGQHNVGQLQIHKKVAPGYGEASASCPGKIPHNLSGHVWVAQLVLQLKDTTQYTYAEKGEWIKLSFFNFYAVDTSGKKISLTAINDSVLVQPKPYKPAPVEIVYPGDADKNMEADYRDLLSVGIGYGSTGPARAQQGITWQGDTAKPWNQRTFYADYAHLDCDGNGAIEFADVQAITKNYDQTREKVRNSTSSGSPLEFRFEYDTLYAGDIVHGFIDAGSSAVPLKNMNGLCFSYEYSTDLQKSGTYGFYWSAAPFPWYMHQSVSDGYGEASLTRRGKDPVTFSTPVEIGKIQFKLKDSLEHSYPEGGEWVKFSFYNFYAVDSFGRKIPLKAIADSVLVLRKKDTTTSIRPGIIAGDIKVYPNPARQEVFVESGGSVMKEIVLTNMIGEVVIREVARGKKIKLETSHLKPGMYTLQVQTNKGIAVQKLIIR